MIQMVARIRQFFAGLSLLLCLGTALLWVRSYWASDAVSWQSRPIVDMRDYEQRLDSGTPTPLPPPTWNISVCSSRGGLAIEVLRQSDLGSMGLFPDDSGWHYERGSAEIYPEHSLELPYAWNSPHVLGFQFGRYIDSDNGNSQQYVIAPLASIAGVLGLLPGVEAWLTIRRRTRRRRGQCPGCGYDLRASKDRCPECGRSVAATSDSRSGG
jgi:hypothetical protein